MSNNDYLNQPIKKNDDYMYQTPTVLRTDYGKGLEPEIDYETDFGKGLESEIDYETDYGKGLESKIDPQTNFGKYTIKPVDEKYCSTGGLYYDSLMFNSDRDLEKASGRQR